MDLHTLTINDIDNQPISYQKSSVSNTYQHKLSLEEIYKIFKQDNDMIFKINTIDSIAYILDDDSEVSLHEFDDEKMIPKLLKISNNDLTDTNNEILIGLTYDYLCGEDDYDSYYIMSWQTEHFKLSAEKYIKDFYNLNAYNKCQSLLRVAKLYKSNDCNFSSTNYLPALNFCNSLIIDTEKSCYIGYLPSSLQLSILCKYQDLLTYILTQIFFYKLINFRQFLWTCDETGDSTVSTYIPASFSNGRFDNQNKFVKNSVFPLFKRIP